MIKNKLTITVENTNDETPAKSESDNKVSNTLIPTFLESMVVNKKFESLRIFNTFPELFSVSHKDSIFGLFRKILCSINPIKL